MFIYKNEISANYIYQWKSLFSNIVEEKVHYGKKQIFELDQFISDVFEQTGHYDEYVNIKLEPICNYLMFTNYNYDKLRLLITMIESSKRLKSGKMNEIIIDTIVSEKYSNIIFFPLTFQESKGKVSVMQPDIKNILSDNRDIKITGEKYPIGETVVEITETELSNRTIEFDYITDLVNTAVKLFELAPSKFTDRIAKFFPQKACLSIIYNFQLPGNLRGSFLQVYKCIYLNSQI
jgi:hypothetical protein